MKVEKVKLIYFSPTGTTQKVLESIARGIAVEDVEHVNLTLQEGAQQTMPPFRGWDDPMMKNIAGLLSQYFSYPKEPRLFGIDM